MISPNSQLFAIVGIGVVLLAYILTSLVIGLFVAIPVGPLSILCIKYALEHGIMGAALIGTGIALADTFYAMIAALGLYSVSQFLIAHVSAIKFVGGACLLYLGYKELRAVASKKLVKLGSGNLKLIWKSFLLTLTNPITILTFIGVFASVDLVAVTIWQVLLVACGVFLGSMSWWLFLGTIISKFRAKVSVKMTNRIRYVSVAVLMSFGLWAIASGVSALVR